MHKLKSQLIYEASSDADILRSYIHKNAYNRSDARKIKRELRRLKFSAWVSVQ